MSSTSMSLPGDPDPETMVARMIRVDHAGEYGAERIYQGQLAVLGRRGNAAVIHQMLEQESHHRRTFDGLIADRAIRPTALLPLWHVAGFALGAASALLGERGAMACTVAVEEAIDEHYARQADALPAHEETLRETIETFRAEELEHRDIGLANEAELAPGYRIMSRVIKTGCRIAIAVSERI